MKVENMTFVLQYHNGLAYFEPAAYYKQMAAASLRLFSIYVGTTREETEKLMRVLIREIKKITNGINNDEVKRAKAQIKASLLMGLESTSNRCIQIARQTAIYNEPINIKKIIEKIDSLDTQSISTAAKNLFKEKPTLAAVGQIDKILEYEEIIAQLN